MLLLVYGFIYGDGWFEGVFWSYYEEFILYVVEEFVNFWFVYGLIVLILGINYIGVLEVGNWKG